MVGYLVALPLIYLTVSCCEAANQDKDIVSSSPKIVEVNPKDGGELQQALNGVVKSGGVLRIVDVEQIVCPNRTDTIEGEQSTHALIVPPNVELDLNGKTLLLDLRENCYGVRLMSHSTIRNGSIKIVRSENRGSQAAAHSAVSVGACYGDGGTPEHPSAFNDLTGWRMEDLTIDQPFNTACIQIMSASSHGTIRRINSKDSPEAMIVVALDWGTVGDGTAEDKMIPKMRELWEAGKFYSTHPHDILIEDINAGQLNDKDANYSGVRCSACYNITIRNVKVKSAATAVCIVAGDFGFEFARGKIRELAHTGYLIENISIEAAKMYGMVLNGNGDNVYRSRRDYNYDSLLDPVHPGLNGVVVRNVNLKGQDSQHSRGFFITACTDLTIENADVSGFETGLAVNDWVHSLKVINCNLHDNVENTFVGGVIEPPVDVVIE